MAAATFMSLLASVAPNASPRIAKGVEQYLAEYGPKFGLNTPKRIAAFLSQAAHETDGFKTLKEYASGTKYEGRKDLGNTYKGDGVRFKGRGIFQTTGRYNYQAVSKKIFGDDRLINKPELLEDPKNAVLSALHFWNDKGLNKYADAGDTLGLTKKINGGTNGLTERMKYMGAIVAFMTANPLFVTEFLKKKFSKQNPFARLFRGFPGVGYLFTGE